VSCTNFNKIFIIGPSLFQNDFEIMYHCGRSKNSRLAGKQRQKATWNATSRCDDSSGMPHWLFH